MKQISLLLVFLVVCTLLSHSVDAKQVKKKPVTKSELYPLIIHESGQVTLKAKNGQDIFHLQPLLYQDKSVINHSCDLYKRVLCGRVNMCSKRKHTKVSIATPFTTIKGNLGKYSLRVGSYFNKTPMNIIYAETCASLKEPQTKDGHSQGYIGLAERKKGPNNFTVWLESKNRGYIMNGFNKTYFQGEPQTIKLDNKRSASISTISFGNKTISQTTFKVYFDLTQKKNIAPSHLIDKIKQYLVQENYFFECKLVDHKKDNSSKLNHHQQSFCQNILNKTFEEVPILQIGKIKIPSAMYLSARINKDEGQIKSFIYHFEFEEYDTTKPSINEEFNDSIILGLPFFRYYVAHFQHLKVDLYRKIDRIQSNNKIFEMKGVNVENIRHFDDEGFDENGFDKDGFDRDGYNSSGRDREGYGKSGYRENGYDREGFDENGIDFEGYDREGYNQRGFDREGYNREGYDIDGNRREDQFAEEEENYEEDINNDYNNNEEDMNEKYDNNEEEEEENNENNYDEDNNDKGNVEEENNEEEEEEEEENNEEEEENNEEEEEEENNEEDIDNGQIGEDNLFKDNNSSNNADKIEPNSQQSSKVFPILFLTLLPIILIGSLIYEQKLKQNERRQNQISNGQNQIDSQNNNNSNSYDANRTSIDYAPPALTESQMIELLI